MHTHTHTHTHTHIYIHVELEALAEIIGPYGIRFMGEKLMEQIGWQVKKIRDLVVQNQDTLLGLHTNRDKPEVFYEVMRKIKSKSHDSETSISLFCCVRCITIKIHLHRVLL